MKRYHLLAPVLGMALTLAADIAMCADERLGTQHRRGPDLCQADLARRTCNQRLCCRLRGARLSRPQRCHDQPGPRGVRAG